MERQEVVECGFKNLWDGIYQSKDYICYVDENTTKKQCWKIDSINYLSLNFDEKTNKNFIQINNERIDTYEHQSLIIKNNWKKRKVIII